MNTGGAMVSEPTPLFNDIVDHRIEFVAVLK